MKLLPEYYLVLDIHGVDPLRLEQARNNVLTDLKCSVLANADRYHPKLPGDVPVDLLESFVMDWYVSERLGMPPISATEFLRIWGVKPGRSPSRNHASILESHSGNNRSSNFNGNAEIGG